MSTVSRRMTGGQYPWYSRGVRNGLKYRAANIDQSQARMLVRNNTRFVGGALVGAGRGAEGRVVLRQ